jgi:hypothetical protein
MSNYRKRKKEVIVWYICKGKLLRIIPQDILNAANADTERNSFYFTLCIFNFLKLLIYSYVHTLFGSFLLPAPFPYPLFPYTPQFQAGPVLPLSLILLKKRHKPNKEEKAFF